MRLLAVLLFLMPSQLGSADLAPITDAELIEAVDATTMLGMMARGTWAWSEARLGVAGAAGRGWARPGQARLGGARHGRQGGAGRD